MLNLLHRTHRIIVNTPNRIEDLPRAYNIITIKTQCAAAVVVTCAATVGLQPDRLSVRANRDIKKLHPKLFVCRRRRVSACRSYTLV